MTLIRYAGFDPGENDFNGVDLAPLHEQDQRTPLTRMDIKRIWSLKHSGMGWDAIGRLLAKEEGRAMPYRGTSVWVAANKARAA